MVRCFGFLVLLGLAGCGGGGAASRTQSQVASFAALHDSVVNSQITPFGQIPAGGRHTYAGQMRLDLPLGATPSAAYYGDLTLGLDVGAATITATGTAGGFTTADQHTLGGALAISGGTFLPNADPDRYFLMFADIGGRLNDGGVGYDLTGRIAADFYGSSGEGVAGLVFGDIAQGGNIDVFDGTFAAKKTP